MDSNKKYFLMTVAVLLFSASYVSGSILHSLCNNSPVSLSSTLTI